MRELRGPDDYRLTILIDDVVNGKLKLSGATNLFGR